MRKVGRYRVVERLAVGGMAEVHLAVDERSGEEVVLKLLRPEVSRDDDHKRMLVAEWETCSVLKHPNIIRAIEHGEIDGAPYLVLERLRGSDVGRLRRDARKAGIPIPVEVVLALAIATCNGLHFAHNAKDAHGRPLHIVHRDISPQNIFVTTDGVAKLIDFGIAKNASRQWETQHGLLKGKVPFMAPEQIRNEALDARTDVYALGVVMYDLLLGRRPYDAIGPEFAQMLAIVRGEIARPRTIDPRFSPDLEAILLKALAADPRDRFPTASALGERLRAFASQSGITPTTSTLERFLATLSRAAGDARRGDREDDEEDDGAGPLETVSRVDSLDGVAVVTMDAQIAESFAGASMGRQLRRDVLLDLGQVKRISSFGVREWLQMMAAVPEGTNVYLCRCSPAITAQMSMVRDFAGRAQVCSFLAPFACADCGEAALVLLSRDQVRRASPPGSEAGRACARCGGRLRLDEHDDHFSFVARLRDELLPAHVKRAIEALDARYRDSPGGRLEKIVDPESTCLRLGHVAGRPRWARALEGVEGRLVIDFDGTAGPEVDVEGLVAALATHRDVSSLHLVKAPAESVRALLAVASVAQRSCESVTLPIACAPCRSEQRAVVSWQEMNASSSAHEVTARCLTCGTAQRTSVGTPKPAPAAASASAPVTPRPPAKGTRQWPWMAGAALIGMLGAVAAYRTVGSAPTASATSASAAPTSTAGSAGTALELRTRGSGPTQEVALAAARDAALVALYDVVKARLGGAVGELARARHVEVEPSRIARAVESQVGAWLALERTSSTGTVGASGHQVDATYRVSPADVDRAVEHYGRTRRVGEVTVCGPFPNDATPGPIVVTDVPALGLAAGDAIVSVDGITTPTLDALGNLPAPPRTAKTQRGDEIREVVLQQDKKP